VIESSNACHAPHIFKARRLLYHSTLGLRVKKKKRVEARDRVVKRLPERDLFIDNLLVRIHVIIVMIRWTGLAPWEIEFPFPGSLTSTFLGLLTQKGLHFRDRLLYRGGLVFKAHRLFVSPNSRLKGQNLALSVLDVPNSLESRVQSLTASELSRGEHTHGSTRGRKQAPPSSVYRGTSLKRNRPPPLGPP